MAALRRISDGLERQTSSADDEIFMSLSSVDDDGSPPIGLNEPPPMS